MPDGVLKTVGSPGEQGTCINSYGSSTKKNHIPRQDDDGPYRNSGGLFFSSPAAAHFKPCTLFEPRLGRVSTLSRGQVWLATAPASSLRRLKSQSRPNMPRKGGVKPSLKILNSDVIDVPIEGANPRFFSTSQLTSLFAFAFMKNPSHQNPTNIARAGALTKGRERTRKQIRRSSTR